MWLLAIKASQRWSRARSAKDVDAGSKAKRVVANPATTSWIFRAFGDVSLAGTPWEGSGMRQRNSGSSYTVIYGIPAIV